MTVVRLWEVLGRRWLLILLVTGAVVYVSTLKAERLLFNSEGIYGSSGKLLLRRTSGRARSLGSAVQIHPTMGTAADVWFFDSQRARRLVEDEKFLARVRKHLDATQSQKLTNDSMRARILVSPTSLSFDRLLEVQDESGQESEEDLQELESIELASSYFQRGTLRTLSVSAWGDSPEAARQLAQGVVEELLVEAGERASRVYTTRRIALESLLRQQQAQIAKAEEALRRQRGVEWSPSELQDHLHLLEATRIGLRSKLLSLESSVASLRAGGHRPVTSVGASAGLQKLRGAQDKLTSQLLAEEKVYAPGHPRLQELRQQLAHLSAAEEQEWQELAASLLAEKTASAAALEGLLAELGREASRLRKLTGSEQRLHEAVRLEKAVRQWEASTNLLLGKYYKARIEEREALNHGTLVVLEKPQPGIPLKASPTVVGVRQAAMVAVIPIGLFAGLLLALAADVYQRRHTLPARVTRDLGLPVLASLPPLARADARSWQAWKRTLFDTPQRRS